MVFGINTIVWAKLGKSPHWPSKVVKPEDFPNIMPPKRCKNLSSQRLVHFYESNDLAWVNIRYLCDFTEHREKFMKTKMRSLQRAIERADLEIQLRSQIPTLQSGFTSSSTLIEASSNQQRSAEVASDERPTDAPTTSQSKSKKYGFIGLENYSCYLAVNLCKSGYDVTVWSLIPIMCKRIVKVGAKHANSIDQLVANCDVIFSCWSDAEKAYEHAYGLHGVANFIKSGKDFIEMSPISINEIKHLQEVISSQGGRFLDCPFFGGLEEAETAKVIFCASGNRSLYFDLLPCFKLLGSKSFFNNRLGSGSSLKTTLYMITGNFTASIAEALAMATKIDLDPNLVMEVLKIIGVSTEFLEKKAERFLERKRENFQIRMQQTEMRLAIDLADSNNSSVPVTTAVNELLKKAKTMGYGSKDISFIYQE